MALHVCPPVSIGSLPGLSVFILEVLNCSSGFCCSFRLRAVFTTTVLSADVAAPNADYLCARLESGREITRGKGHGGGWSSVGCRREVLWLFTCASPESPLQAIRCLSWRRFILFRMLLLEFSTIFCIIIQLMQQRPALIAVALFLVRRVILPRAKRSAGFGREVLWLCMWASVLMESPAGDSVFILQKVRIFKEALGAIFAQFLRYST